MLQLLVEGGGVALTYKFVQCRQMQGMDDLEAYTSGENRSLLQIQDLGIKVSHESSGHLLI